VGATTAPATTATIVSTADEATATARRNGL